MLVCTKNVYIQKGVMSSQLGKGSVIVIPLIVSWRHRRRSSSFHPRILLWRR